MRKKHALPAFLLSVTTTFGMLTFAACTTTNSSTPEESAPVYYEETDSQKINEIGEKQDTGIHDSLNYDGSKIKPGILIDDTDTSLKKRIQQ